MYHAEPLVDSRGKCPRNPPLCPMMPHTRCMTNETQTNNPYVATLVEMGYDEADCQMVAHAEWRILGLLQNFASPPAI